MFLLRFRLEEAQQPVTMESLAAELAQCVPLSYLRLRKLLDVGLTKTLSSEDLPGLEPSVGQEVIVALEAFL